MRRDIFEPGDSVLLLGEGNFSFSVGLLNIELEIKLTATCYESVLTKKQFKNCELLTSRGVCVLSGIDATKIHEHPLLMTKKFDKIIFNFPHTGGKMKISLNRELLRSFFLSASNLLAEPGGNIVVSLCSGQGADYLGKRIWTDSWQVVEMAGHANLLLVECSSFDWSLFPSYSNVGYRSLEKGFHSEDAVVHRFSLVKNSLHLQVESIFDFYLNGKNGDPASHPLFVRRLNQDILSNNLNPISFILNILEKQVGLNFKCRHHMENKTLTTVSQKGDSIASALQLWAEYDCDILLYSFYVLNRSVTDFQRAPVITQTLLIGKDNCDTFVAAIFELMSMFKMTNYTVVVKNNNEEAQSTKKFLLQSGSEFDEYLLAEMYPSNCGTVIHPVILIHVDTLAFIMFPLSSWRQLWAKNVHVTVQSGKPCVIGICPYPICYTFDISFAVNKYFTEDTFFTLLWDVAGEIITNVVKVSEFYCVNNNERSLCFRLSYVSYEHPMCRKTVLDFHQNVLGSTLERILGVCIK